MRVKTSTGYETDINPNRLNDYRFVNALAKLSKQQADIDIMLSFDELHHYILTPAQDDALIDHVASLDEDGIADYQKVTEEFQEILTQLKENEEVKN